VVFQELETRDRLPLSPDLLRREYLEKLEAHRAALAATVGSYGGDYQLIRTDEPPFRALGTYLARRKGAL